MKKALIPFITLLLTGCSCSLFSFDGTSLTEPSSEITSAPTLEPTSEPTSIPTSEPTTIITSEEPSTSTSKITNIPQPVEEFDEGAEHELPWNLDYSCFQDPSGSLSYFSYNRVYDFEGTNVYGYGMRAVTDISVNVNGQLTPFKGFQIIHFAKKNHDIWPDGGQIQISKIKPTKLVLELVSYGKYSYSYTKTLSVFFDGQKVNPPRKADNESPSAVNSAFTVYYLTFDINAEYAAKVTLKNEQSFSMYIQSIQFE